MQRLETRSTGYKQSTATMLVNKLHRHLHKNKLTAGTIQLSISNALYSVPPICWICSEVKVSVLKLEFRPTTSPLKFSHGVFFSSSVVTLGIVIVLFRRLYVNGAARLKSWCIRSMGPGKPPKPGSLLLPLGRISEVFCAFESTLGLRRGYGSSSEACVRTKGKGDVNGEYHGR